MISITILIPKEYLQNFFSKNIKRQFDILEPEEVEDLQVDKWIEKRSQKGIHSKVLVPETDIGKDIVATTSDAFLRKTRYLPKSFRLEATIGTYGNKVAFFSSKKENISFIVESAEFSKTIQECFDFRHPSK